MAINKQMQKACPRLPDLVGHSQIEAERLQNQPGSFLGCSEAIWYRSLMLHGRLPEAPGRTRATPKTPGTLQDRLGDVSGGSQNHRCVKRLRRRNQKLRNALSRRFFADVCQTRRSANVRSDTVKLRFS